MTTTTIDPAEYVGLLNIPEGQSRKYRVRHIVEPARKILSDVNARGRIFGQTGRRFRYDTATRWHELSYDGGVWMTDTPIEQRQMYEAAVQLHGRVLIGGLGLGVIVTMLSKLARVRSIVVIEKSPDVLKLVRPYLPTENVSVIRADLFTFLRGGLVQKMEGFDTAFFDIWQGDGEATFHETVVPLLKHAHDSGQIRTRPLCWNEDVMRGQLELALSTRVSLYGQLSASQREGLTTLMGNIWHDWAVPFWTAARNRGWLDPLNRDELNKAAAAYALDFGDPWRDG